MCKIYAEAKKKGQVGKEHLGIDIIVKEQYESVSNEVRRVGLIKDRDADIEIRVGDLIVIYVTRTKA